MSRSDPASFIDRLVELAVGLLIAAIALYGAVSLVRAIWSTLLLLLGGALLVTVLVGIWRSRNRGW